MYKYIIILFVFITSCTQYTAHPFPEKEYTVILENSFIEVALYEDSNRIKILNISNQLIIEITYTSNGKQVSIYDVFVPSEILELDSTYKKDIVFTIDLIRTH